MLMLFARDATAQEHKLVRPPKPCAAPTQTLW